MLKEPIGRSLKTDERGGCYCVAKKDCVSLHIRVDADIVNRFNAYCKEVSKTKTLAIEEIMLKLVDEYEQDRDNRRLLEETGIDPIV